MELTATYSEFIIISDRLSTKKVFYSTINKCIWISARLRSQHSPFVSLNAKAIAWYLVNGVYLNDETIFNEIRQTQNAKIIVLSKYHNDVKEYWNLNFKSVKINKKEAKNELLKILKAAIYKTVSGEKDIYLSLSGKITTIW